MALNMTFIGLGCQQNDRGKATYSTTRFKLPADNVSSRSCSTSSFIVAAGLSAGIIAKDSEAGKEAGAKSVRGSKNAFLAMPMWEDQALQLPTRSRLGLPLQAWS